MLSQTIFLSFFVCNTHREGQREGIGSDETGGAVETCRKRHPCQPSLSGSREDSSFVKLRSLLGRNRNRIRGPTPSKRRRRLQNRARRPGADRTAADGPGIGSTPDPVRGRLLPRGTPPRRLDPIQTTSRDAKAFAAPDVPKDRRRRQDHRKSVRRRGSWRPKLSRRLTAVLSSTGATMRRPMRQI